MIVVSSIDSARFLVSLHLRTSVGLCIFFRVAIQPGYAGLVRGHRMSVQSTHSLTTILTRRDDGFQPPVWEKSDKQQRKTRITVRPTRSDIVL